MTFTRLANAIKKIGLEVIVSHPESHPDMFYVSGPNKYYGSFYKQGDRAICVSVCRKGDSSDAMTDYFPQRYCDSIKEFINCIQR